jgi:hypothetical protein
VRRAARKDANQTEMVKALRRHEFKVAITHRLGDGMPDIIASGPLAATGRWALLWVEVKSPGGVLTPDEREFHDRWHDAPVIVAYNHHDVLAWFGWRETPDGELARIL